MRDKKKTVSPESFMTTEELSGVIHMDVGTIRNRLSRGDAMPPSLVIGRRRLFPISKFNNWVEARVKEQEKLDRIQEVVVEDGFEKYR